MARRASIIVQFSALFPGVDPAAATAAQWGRLRRMAYQNQNGIVDVGKRHTARSRYWAKIGDAARVKEQVSHDYEKTGGAR